MTLRERALSILNGKTPDRLPWYGDLSYWHFAMTKKGSLEERYKGFEGVLNLHNDLGIGFYLQGYEPYRPVYKNCEVIEVERTVGNSYEDFTPVYRGSKVIKIEGNNDIIREVLTPKGKIRERWKYCHESYSWAPQEYFVNSVEDLKVLKYWIEHTDYDADYEQGFLVRGKVRDQGCVLCYQPKSPLMQMIVLYAGIINTINLMVDNKRLFDETIVSLEEKAKEAAELTLNSPAEFVMIPENLSSDVIGKRLFEEYLRPYHEKWNEKIRARGKHSFIYFDGCLRSLLKEVASVGFSAIEAMTPEPGGDLPVEEFSKYVGGNTIMWGGLPGILFVPSVNDDDFEEYVLRVIRLMTSEPRYVLGIADQVPPDGIIERVKKVAEMVEKYAMYDNRRLEWKE